MELCMIDSLVMQDDDEEEIRYIDPRQTKELPARRIKECLKIKLPDPSS